MIVLNVTYKCRSGKRPAFLDAIVKEGIDSASRAEEGNYKYDYYLSTADSDELLLVEKWRDKDAIAEHSASAHYKRLGELKSDCVEETVIERFEA